LSARAPEIAEKVGAGIEDQHVVAAAECRAIGLEAAIERKELGVRAEGRGIDRGGLCVAFALDLLRLPVRFGNDDFALTIVGANFSSPA
jgi:hypothetical protein